MARSHIILPFHLSIIILWDRPLYHVRAKWGRFTQPDFVRAGFQVRRETDKFARRWLAPLGEVEALVATRLGADEAMTGPKMRRGIEAIVAVIDDDIAVRWEKAS